MAVTEVGTPGAVQIQSGSDTGSVTGAWSGTQPRTAGDYLVAEVTAAGTTTAGAISTPSGWTQLATIQSGNDQQQVAIYGKVAAGSDAAPTFTATMTGTAATERMSCFLREYTGQDPTTPVPTTGTGTAASSPVTITSGANVPSAGCMAVACTNTETSTAGTPTYAAGTGFTNDYNTGSTSARFHSASDSQAGPASGATVTDAPTSTGDVTTQMTGVLIVIQPAASSVTGTASVALAPLALAGTGLAGITGTGSVALAPMALAGTGLIGAVTGTGSVALAPMALAGTGLIGAVSGTGSVALAPLALAGTGLAGVTGTASIALAPLRMAASGLAGITGTARIALAPLRLYGTGNLFIPPLGIFIYSGPPALGNLILSSSPVAGTDQAGNIFPAGFYQYDPVTGDTVTIDAGQITFSNLGYTGAPGSLQYVFGDLVMTSPSPIGGTGSQLVLTAAPLQPYAQLQSAAGGAIPLYTAQPNGPGVQESWHSLTGFAAGWAIGSGSAEYMLTPMNELKIAIRNLSPGTTTTDGTTILSSANGIPSAWQPATARRFPVAVNILRQASAGIFEGAALEIETDGSIQCYGIAAAATRVDGYAILPLDSG